MTRAESYELTKAEIQQQLGFSFTASEEEWMLQLEARINELILSDFSRLLQLLYRLDVDEKKLQSLLKQNPSVDAGRIIASLIMDRQHEKMESRNRYKEQFKTNDEEERW